MTPTRLFTYLGPVLDGVPLDREVVQLPVGVGEHEVLLGHLGRD